MIDVADLIKAPWTPSNLDGYETYSAHPAKGVLYITHDNPEFISGHIRVRGENNGSYPHFYTEMIENLFGESKKTIEVCSYKIQGNKNLFTVDINPDYKPHLVADGQDLSDLNDNQFTRWRCDPPYNAATAKKMYNCDVPSPIKLLKAGARLITPGSLMFLLLGPQNYQWHPKGTKRIGIITMTVVPNNEIRALNIYLKL
jgi:hypothetical protein